MSYIYELCCYREGPRGQRHPSGREYIFSTCDLEGLVRDGVWLKEGQEVFINQIIEKVNEVHKP